MIDLSQARKEMVESQLARRGVSDPRVLEAMAQTPREAFLPPHMADLAYRDSPLPIDAGQTISQPYIVAVMIQAAGIGPQDTVLEIGAGSGYAAAVMARLARRVHTIERHPELARSAKGRLANLGYHNVEVHEGDGSGGLPGAAPFDAILVAAGGREIPQALKAQLAIGGILVMPVGEVGCGQRLVKLTRTAEATYHKEDLGAVAFVPLIGKHGWPQAGEARRPPEPRSFRPRERVGISALIAQAAEPLPSFDDPDFGALFDRFGEARIVLLGEASHGTSEFYQARAAITRRLIEEHGFTILAVEADWPDAASIDRHVRHKPAIEGAEPAFRRFPTWMWRNTDVEAFVLWLRAHNAGRRPSAMTGFYGLDLYNLSASMRAVIDYLDRVDPAAAVLARQRYACLSPWRHDPQAYGAMAMSSGYARCEDAVARMLTELCARQFDYALKDGEDFLDASQNARLVRDAEQYYRVMHRGSAESWNLRDRHMFETLCQLLDAKGPGAKAVVWAHNSHIGDASKTQMGRERGEWNIGQLCRERFCGEAALIGLGTHAGTVACASDWDEPMQIKPVNPSLPGSCERLAHDAGLERWLLDLRPGPNRQVARELTEPRLERFIGVIYRPETERWSHYAECSLAGQFDAFVWFDTTTAVTPLPGRTPAGPNETYPFGL